MATEITKTLETGITNHKNDGSQGKLVKEKPMSSKKNMLPKVTISGVKNFEFIL